MESIRDILIRRDNLTTTSVDDLIQEAREAFSEYLDDGDIEGAENICSEYFGLDPDYLDEFY